MEGLKTSILAALRTNSDRQPNASAAMFAAKFVEYFARWKTVSVPSVDLTAGGDYRFVWAADSYAAELVLGNSLYADIEWLHGVHTSEADEVANLLEGFQFWLNQSKL